MDFKIEETQGKLEDDSVKTETKDWFSKMACKTEDKPKVEDTAVQGVHRSMRTASDKPVDIIDLTMDD
jgi:hypothetical protein